MVDTKNISCIMAFLIGVREDILEKYYNAECVGLLDTLRSNTNALQIRYLSIIRTQLMRRYSEIDSTLHYTLNNIDSMQDYFDKENITSLKKIGINVIIPNSSSEKYFIHLNNLILSRIDTVKDLFGDWINWEYIRKLFIITGIKDKNDIKREVDLYKRNISFYPFQMYIHWKPSDYGYIFTSDKKFINLLYSLNDDTFDDYMKYKDADDDTKNSIYSFINAANTVAIFVDCENSDAFKLMNALNSLDSEETSKISKIVLYQDSEHTTSGWNFIEKVTNIPVEHNVITRIKDNKSLVDTMMVAGVTKSCFRDNVDSFIILASDSDYCSMYGSITEAKFLVMLEKEKCSYDLIEMLKEYNISYCAIDDFNSSNSESIKKEVLLSEFESILPKIYGMKPMDITLEVYRNSMITSTYKEMEVFCNRYVKTLKIKFDIDDGLVYEIQR